MVRPTESSSLKIPYNLRMAKQIERHMIVDALQILSRAHFPISDYQYTGLGSIFFVDFIMFHKILGIHRMLSVEFSKKIKKRVKFNRPFRNIKIEYGRIGEFIPSLSKDLKHMVWLDYDYRLNRDDVLTDVILACSELSCGSILLVTVDLEMPKLDRGQKTYWTAQERFEYYSEQAGQFFEQNIPRCQRPNHSRKGNQST